jgi:isoprenylcysteine carboxyl methyltransferase (ICMT) family protein YpbQ
MSTVVHAPAAKGGLTSTLFKRMLVSSSSRRVAASYLSTLAFIGLSYLIVSRLSNFHRSMLQGQWQLGLSGIDVAVTVHDLFVVLIALYAVILVPYYIAYPWMRSKAFVFAQGLWFAVRRDRTNPQLSPLARQAGLALLLKFFFAPLMLNWCLIHIANLTGSVQQLVDGIDGGLSGRALFDTSLFWAAFQLILFIDTLLFTVGYIVELPALGNRIRTVEPTFFGWFICLACYPPFNDLTLRFLEWPSSDFPQFANDFLHLAVNAFVLVALALFSWASIALGLKASNLTNRGIVTHGPYAFVRHPGYAAKNLAWWLGALPAIGMAFANSQWRAVTYSLLALFGWTIIYALRATTEERHLLRSNNGYAEYAQKVRWRFVPGMW